MDILNDIVKGALGSSMMERDARTLAERKLMCMSMLEDGICDRKECVKCTKMHDYAACMGQLPIAGKMRVEQEAERMFSRRCLLRRMDEERMRRERMFPVKVAIVILLLFVLGMRLVSASPLEERITDTLERTRANVSDVNRDGSVDCVDWAVTFKNEWEKKYPAGLCRLVYNYNKSIGWAHMLVRVKYMQDDYWWTYVEPQGNADVWNPSVFWGNKYSPYWNSDDTERWLR